jgi:hypothetical protein
VPAASPFLLSCHIGCIRRIRFCPLDKVVVKRGCKKSSLEGIEKKVKEKGGNQKIKKSYIMYQVAEFSSLFFTLSFSLHHPS